MSPKCRIESLQYLLQMIPPVKLELLSRFAIILKRTSEQKNNKMEVTSLATIIVPVILVPTGFEENLLDPRGIAACSFIIENAFKLKKVEIDFLK